MRPAFLDRVGLIATWDAGDQWHEVATQAFGRLLAGRVPFVTTSYILAECGNAAARTPFRRDVFDLRERLEALGQVITPSESDWASA